MEAVKVMYVTEEEKKRILDMRMEQERKVNKKHLTTYEKHHRMLGWIMLGMALVCLYIGGEAFIGTMFCGIFAIIGFCAKEEIREEWTE